MRARVVLQCLALVCFVGATYGVWPRVNLVPAGLALWLASQMLV